ncbi:YcaO-like family protein [Streptomyces sp. NPDC046385]|uniref:YcaO-like family protein n=1 Tax=Streptomyces sp. NPDC046385 TaxID=3154918 RepID=UPI0033C6823E
MNDGVRPAATDTLGLLEDLLVRRSGSISSLQPLDDFYNDEPRGQGWVAQLPPNAHRPQGTAALPRATGGRGRDRLARLKAVMEAAERVSLSTVPPERLTYGTAAELSDRLGPETFPEPWRGSPVWERPMHWCRAVRIGAEEAGFVLVPAQLVYCPYWEPDRQAMLWDPSSNGAAAAFSYGDAVARASREAFERHVILLAHYLRLGGEELDWLDLALEPGALLMGLEARTLGLRVRVACLVRTPFPVVVCVVVDPTKRFPALTTGSACAVTVEQAASSAISEALHARRQARDFLTDVPPVEASDLETIEERVVYWGQPDAPGRLEYLFGGSRPLEGTYTQGYLDEGYAAEVTAPQLADAGVSVVKVVHPRLQPLFFAESDKLLLEQARRSALSTDPHPYA